MPPIVYEPNRKRLALLFLGALAFTVLCAVVLFAHPTIKTVVAGVVGVPFFALCAGLYGYRLVRHAPELTITDEGFEHRSWGRVGWDEVEIVSVRTQQVRNRQHLWVQVVLKDPDATFARQHVGARMLSSVNRRWGRHIFIATGTLPASFDEVLAAMQQTHQRFLGFDPVSAG